MGLSNTIDVTPEFVANNAYTADMSGWDYIIITLVGSSGTRNLTATNDGGAIEGVSDGNSLSALNFTTVSGIKLSDNSAVTSAADGQTKVINSGRYLKIGGSGATASKCIIEFFKVC